MTKVSELAHLFRTLKAPAAARATPKLAERAREEDRSHERFVEAVLQTEVASRESHGGEARIKAARFPARKTLEEFDFSFQRSPKKAVVEHLGQLHVPHARENVVLAGPPDTGKTHLVIAVSIRACLAGQRVQFATATEWVARLGDAKPRQAGRGTAPAPVRPADRRRRGGAYPFDPEAADPMFSPVRPLTGCATDTSAWPHSPRLRHRPAPLRPTGSAPQGQHHRGWSTFSRRRWSTFRPALTRATHGRATQRRLRSRHSLPKS